VSIKDRVGCALLQQALSCVLTHTGFMGSRKLNSLMVVELDDTLPRFTNDIGTIPYLISEVVLSQRLSNFYRK
jgi:hypothetical protein